MKDAERDIEFVKELSSENVDGVNNWDREKQILELDDEISSSEDKKGQKNVFGLTLKPMLFE